MAKERYDEAEAIVLKISADEYTPMILCEIHYHQKKYDQVLKDTEDESPDTNESAALDMYRAMALREKGDTDAAIILFKEIIKNRSLDKAINIRSRYERALAYQKAGDKKKALADFEFIVTKDSDYLDVNELISKLKKSL
jgi:tetratricopeptide (TPR) repeat protein